MESAEQRLQPRELVLLTDALGIEAQSFVRIAIWAMSERLVAEMKSEVAKHEGLMNQPDALKQFRNLLRHRTGRNWSQHDYEALFDRVKLDTTKHFRDPIPIEDLILLYLEEPLKCKKCGRGPPEVRLHIDHILPASRGGSSRRENLQFLCEAHNLKKSNKREVSEPWLDFQ
jgi:5-methylcytosine-specific restriction endonuclease McrA